MAKRRILKLGKRHLLVSHSDIEQDDSRRRIIDDDILNRQPQEELFLGQALHSDQPAVAEISPDDALEENPWLKHGDAGRVEEDLQQPIFSEVVRFDAVLGEKAGGQSSAYEQVVNGSGGCGEREEEEMEEKCEYDEGHWKNVNCAALEERVRTN